MDKKKEEFLARLRETFRVEATEHLEAITAGLMAIERAGDAEHAAIVERVFREAHSLKGAARSVGLKGAEVLCAELEGIFAAMKRRELRLSSETLDAIHGALGILATSCGSSSADPSLSGTEMERQVIAALQRVLKGRADDWAEAPPIEAEPSLSAASDRSKDPTPAPAMTAVAPDTVRVSTKKFAAILLETEELVGAKIAVVGRAAELGALAAELAQWNQRRGSGLSRQHRGRLGAGVAAELLEREILYKKSLEGKLRKAAAAAHQNALSLTAISDRLLEDVKKVLLLPCSYLLGTLPKVVRDLSREQGKDVDLLVSGEDIEIDRRVLDELKDPLIHLLRNCVDHGIEKPDARENSEKPRRGSVTIAVKPIEGNRVEFTVTDDGVGIDVGKVRKAAVRLGLIAADEAASIPEVTVASLVFQSGLSTSPIITDLSGRGLGLAIVREKVEKLGGTVEVTSTPGAGTSFSMLVPLSLATFRGVFVDVLDKRFALPTANVVKVCRVAPNDIKTVENRQVFSLGGRAVALVRLEDVLMLSGQRRRVDGITRPAVVVRAADRQIAFLVDEVLGEQEMMVKSLGPQLSRVPNVAGACVSGSDTVVPIINAIDLVESASKAGVPELIAAVHNAEPERRARLIIAEDSITARTLEKSILEAAGYEVVAAVDGVDALTRLKTEPFDLLVSDVDMPRMNGFELTAKIRADRQLSELPVVLVTALGSQKDREYGIEVGANAYIVKSDFDQGNLLEIIRRLL